MKATLVFPGINLCGWNTFGSGGANENFVPYGLAYVAAFAKSRGHQVDLIDLRRLSGWDAFDSEVRRRSPGVFGISAMSVDFPAAAEAASRIKAADRRSVVVLGGVHATVATGEAEELDCFDHIVLGEGEVSFSDLLSELEKGGAPARVIRGAPPDIETLPYPDRELFDYAAGEAAHPWLPSMEKPFASIMAGRGCPFRCAFCQPAERLIFGGRSKIRSNASIIAELKLLRARYGYRSLLIHDDLFTLNKQQVLEFCGMYRREGLPPSFTCQARADFIVKNEDAVEELVKSGLKCFMIGFESGSQRVLDYLKKGTTVEQNLAAAEVCARHGIMVFANYMFGVPGETRAEVRSTVDFIRRIKPAYPSPAFFTPYPGTELGDRCRAEGLLLEATGSYYNRAAGTGGKIKGVDYDFLAAAAARSLEYERPAGALPPASGGRTLLRKLRSAAGRALRLPGRLRQRLKYLRYGL